VSFWERIALQSCRRGKFGWCGSVKRDLTKQQWVGAGIGARIGGGSGVGATVDWVLVTGVGETTGVRLDRDAMQV